MIVIVNLERLSGDGYKMNANSPLVTPPTYIKYAQLRYTPFTGSQAIQGTFVTGSNSTVEFNVTEANLTRYLKLYTSTDGTTYNEDKSWGGTDGIMINPQGGTIAMYNFYGDNDYYYVAESAITIPQPTEQGTGIATYTYISANGLTTNTATFPLVLATGDKLKMTITGFLNYKNILLKLSIILLMFLTTIGYSQPVSNLPTNPDSVKYVSNNFTRNEGRYFDTITTAQNNSGSQTLIFEYNQSNSLYRIWAGTSLIYQIDSINNITYGATYPYDNATKNPPKINFQHIPNDSNSVITGIGSLGDGEANMYYNFNYDSSIHKKYKQGLTLASWTLNRFGLSYQWLPANTYDTQGQPDVWSRANGPVPLFCDTAGNVTIYGGLKSVFRTSTDNATKYTDTNKFSLFMEGGKNYLKEKLGIGISTPYSKLHLVGDAGSNGGSYNANADLIVDDAGTRALVQLINPNSSYITFGNGSTYNLGYISYTNSSGNLDITAGSSGTINLNNPVSITEKLIMTRSGTATLSAGTITVELTSITANSQVVITPRGITNAGFLGVTYNARVGFTILSSNNSDARVVDWYVIERP